MTAVPGTSGGTAVLDASGGTPARQPVSSMVMAMAMAMAWPWHGHGMSELLLLVLRRPQNQGPTNPLFGYLIGYLIG